MKKVYQKMPKIEMLHKGDRITTKMLTYLVSEPSTNSFTWRPISYTIDIIGSIRIRKPIIPVNTFNVGEQKEIDGLSYYIKALTSEDFRMVHDGELSPYFDGNDWRLIKPKFGRGY